jgi:hypothetical protein
LRLKRISWLGVVVGGVTDIALTNVLTLPVAVYALASGGIMSLPKAQQSTALIALLHANVALYVATTVIGCGCSILAGYVAAWLAKHDETLNGALTSFLCVGFDLYAMAKGAPGEPFAWSHWRLSS